MNNDPKAKDYARLLSLGIQETEAYRDASRRAWELDDEPTHNAEAFHTATAADWQPVESAPAAPLDEHGNPLLPGLSEEAKQAYDERAHG